MISCIFHVLDHVIPECFDFLEDEAEDDDDDELLLLLDDLPSSCLTLLSLGGGNLAAILACDLLDLLDFTDSTSLCLDEEDDLLLLFKLRTIMICGVYNFCFTAEGVLCSPFLSCSSTYKETHKTRSYTPPGFLVGFRPDARLYTLFWVET